MAPTEPLQKVEPLADTKPTLPASPSPLLETISAARLFDLIDDMPIGVSVFDERDRLLQCNKVTLEIAGPNAVAYRPGARFEDIIRSAIRFGIVPVEPGGEDAYVEKRMAWHRDPRPFEFKSGERWIHVNEQRVAGIGTIVYYTDISEQKEAQLALARSEERFRDYAQAASDWLWEIDAEFRYRYHTAESGLGGKHAKYFASPIGHTRWGLAGVSDPDNDSAWCDHVATLRRHEPFRDFRYSFRPANGPMQYYRVNGKPIFDEHGAFAGYRGTTSIETEAVERERRLHERQAQLYEAIQNVPVSLALYDDEDRLVMRNNVERDFGDLAHDIKQGRTFEELFRTSLEAGLFEEARGREEAFVQERLERHRNPRGAFDEKRGDRWLQVREHRMANGYTLVILHDITDIKRAESALRESESKFRNLVEGSLQGVCIHRDLRPLFANQAFATIMGYRNADEVMALPSIDIMFPDDQRERARELIRARQAGERGQESVIGPVLRRSGETIIVESRLGLIEWEGERAIQATVLDVTERETMVRLKDEFVSTVSHELRTPLTSISGALGLIASGMAGHVPPKVGELIEIANNNAERLVRLIGDLLDIQKIEAGQIGGQRGPVSVSALLRASADANRGYAERNGVTIVVHDGAPDSVVDGDMDQLMQVMTNLLSNAVKFSPADAAVDIASVRAIDKVVITVTDRGPGIPSEFRERIFDKFVQVEAGDSRQRGGTGLGLSICKALVEHHGGTLEYVEHDGGARFRVTLPDTAAAPTKTRE